MSATNVSQFAQHAIHHEQQCVRNNLSSFASTFIFDSLQNLPSIMQEADVVRIVESSIAQTNQSLLASMKSMLDNSLADLKRSHADTADSHLKEIKNLKFDVPHRLKRKGNEDQYKFNLKVGDAIEEAEEACSSKQLDKIHASLEKGI